MTELEISSDQTGETEPAISLPFPKATWGRVVYALYIIIMPVLAFWAIGIFKPEWQSGYFSAYLVLSLFPEASLVFFLLLAYSILCYLSLLISPNRDSRLFFIRFGIYTGVFLALQYSVLAALFFLTGSYYPAFMLIWIVPIVYSPLHRWAVARWTARTVNSVLFVLIVLVLAIARVTIGESMPMFILIMLTMAAPFWSFLIALRAALWLFKNYETRFTLPRAAGLTAWLTAYAVAWRFDILRMYELYAALPKEPPPDCYIATAAARGHPRLVQAWTVQHADGKSMRVNRQLQQLKCAELALMAVHPRLHKFLRQIYDVVGKRLAGRLHNPFLADAAYLLLKPWEWSAGVVLKNIVPEVDSISRKMYIN